MSCLPFCAFEERKGKDNKEILTKEGKEGEIMIQDTEGAITRQEWEEFSDESEARRKRDRHGTK